MPKYGYIRVSLSETISGQPNVIYNYPTGEDIDVDAVFDATPKRYASFLTCVSAMLCGHRLEAIISLSSPLIRRVPMEVASYLRCGLITSALCQDAVRCSCSES